MSHGCVFETHGKRMYKNLIKGIESSEFPVYNATVRLLAADESTLEEKVSR